MIATLGGVLFTVISSCAFPGWLAGANELFQRLAEALQGGAIAVVGEVALDGRVHVTRAVPTRS